MDAVIRKWGNSLAIRLPMPVVNKAYLKLEQKVNITVKEGRIITEPLQTIAYALEDLVAGITAENGHGEVSFGGPGSKKYFDDNLLCAGGRRCGVAFVRSTSLSRTGRPSPRLGDQSCRLQPQGGIDGLLPNEHPGHGPPV